MTTKLIVPEVPREVLQRRTEVIGRELFERIGRGPSVWDRAWWDDRLMDLTLGEPEVKIQLFRFIDAMPVLRTTEGVRSHFEEYLAEAGERVPWWMALAAVGLDQGRAANVQPDGGLAIDRQKLAIAPHGPRSRLDRRAAEGLRHGLVVVNDLQRPKILSAEIQGGLGVELAAETTFQAEDEFSRHRHDSLVTPTALGSGTHG